MRASLYLILALTLPRPVSAGEGYPGWETDQGCPCSNQSLCEPIHRVGPERVFAFHVGVAGNKDWTQYDWSQITTVCVFGALDPELLCHAHRVGARVTIGVDIGIASWRNASLVDAWIAEKVRKVHDGFLDGLNLDIEDSATDPDDVRALSSLSARTAEAMHKAVPGSQVTFDVPSGGMLNQGTCGTQYNRRYDFGALAAAMDFLVAMDYDSNAHYPSKCPTCFDANCGLPILEQGTRCYEKLGVPASKLVLAMPWYGYDYTCGPDDKPGDICRIQAAAQISYPGAAGLLLSSSIGGRHWAANTSTPYFYYRDRSSALHRVDYDDVDSLRIKYAYARTAGHRGVGMWTANSLNYTNVSEVSSFWEALKEFEPPPGEDDVANLAYV